MPEIEAKFLLERREQLDDVLSTLADLGHDVKSGPTHNIVDRYFDTDDRLVLRAGWACRWRAADGSNKLTLKSLAGGSGPVFVRDEIDQDLSAPIACDAPLPPGPVQATLEPIVNGHARHELFRVENERATFAVTSHDAESTTLELAVDRATIAPESGKAVSFLELEVELVEGRAERVDEVARALHERLGLVASQMSKFERGLQAAGLDEPAPSETQRRLARRDWPLIDLVFGHLGDLADALEAQRRAAWEGIGAEGVHRMRITLRRLRAVLSAFKRLLPADAAALSRELKWLGASLGSVRDADVYLADIAACRAELPEATQAALGRYEAHLREERSRARRHMLEALESPRYRALIENLESFVRAGPSPGRRRRLAGLDAAQAAELYLERATRKIVKRGRRIGRDASDRALHDLRIRIKRLRFLLEFFASVDPAGMRRALKASKRLQDVLGDHQDATVAQGRLNDYLTATRSPEDAGALALLMRRYASEQQRARDRLSKRWRRFEKVAKRGAAA